MLLWHSSTCREECNKVHLPACLLCLPSGFTFLRETAAGKIIKFAQTLYQRIIKMCSRGGSIAYVVGRNALSGELTAEPKCQVRNASHFIKMLISQRNFARTATHLINLKRDNFRAQPSRWMRVDSQQAIRGSQTLLACSLLLFGRSELRGHVIACEPSRHKKPSEKTMHALSRALRQK